MRSWRPNNFQPEDYPGDEEPGGKGVYYMNCSCGREYFGYKGRVMCKVCRDEHEVKLAAMTPVEREEYETENLKKWLDTNKSPCFAPKGI